MALDVRLSRVDVTAGPWGFWLDGGAKCALPLVVARVQEGSIACRAGLLDGDQVLLINQQSTDGLTHEAAHDLIAQCRDQVTLRIFRDPHFGTESSAPGFEPIPTTDSVLPSQPPEVSSVNRSLTSSPNVVPLKPFRPFSTEPLEGIPPIEKPIILSPFYHDKFGKIKPKDTGPPTKFKLAISKDYVPDVDDETNEMSVTESYSKMLMDTSVLTSLEELNKEIDLQEIEDTASFIVDESLNKAVFVTEEIKQEIDFEFRNETTSSATTSNLTKIVSEISNDSSRVSASLLAQLIDQTADEISKSKETKTTESISLVNELTTKTSNVSNYIETKSIELTEQLQNVEVKSQNSEQTLVEQSKEKSKTEAEEIINEERKSVSELRKSYEDTILAQNAQQNMTESTQKIHKQENANIMNNVITESSEKITAHGQKTEKVERKQEMAKQCESSYTEIQQNISENATKSLTDIKQHAISTANLLAEQRAYTLGLQTIPNIQGHVQSSYHYDLLLKTFFIHLTDVMVALSRLIMSEGTSRSISPMPQRRDPDKVRMEQFTQNTVETNVQLERQENIDLDVKNVKLQESKIVEESKKISVAKLAQLSSLKTEELTQKMDAVISEFKKSSDLDEINVQEHDEVAREFRGKSVSKIEEEVSKESDPLEWLSKIDETKTSISIKEIASTELKQDISSAETVATEEINSDTRKIMYVATVEEHHMSNAETLSNNVSTELSVLNESIDISAKEAIETITTHSQELTSTAEQSICSEVSQKTMLEEKTSESATEISHKESELSTLELSVNQTKRTSITKDTTLVSSSETSSFTQQSNCISQDSDISINREYHQSVSPKSESRKSSIKEINDTLEAEPVRKPTLDTQISVKSDDNNVVVPQTPLTDEYIFRLQMHLEESKCPIREPTPPDPEIHEDPYTVKKPKLIPHIDTTIEPVKYYVDPKTDLESPTGTKEGIIPVINKSLPGTRKSSADEGNGTNIVKADPCTFIPSALPVSFSNVDRTPSLNKTTESSATNIGVSASTTDSSFPVEQLSKIIEDERRKSSILTSAIDDTIKNIESYKREVGMEVSSNETTESVTSTAQNIRKESFVVRNIKDEIRRLSNDATLSVNGCQNGNVNESQNVNGNFNVYQNGNVNGYEKDDVNESQKCNFTGYQNSDVNGYEKDNIKKRQNMNVNGYQGGNEGHNGIINGFRSVNFNSVNTVNVNESHNFSGYQSVNVNESQVVNINESKSVNINGFQSVNFNPCQNGTVNQCNGNVSTVSTLSENSDTTVSVGGTTRGIVDGLDNSGIIDEELAKELGKPGLSEEKVAEMTSGADDMMKEAHVIGLKRVLASHMTRVNGEEDPSEDLQKIKPQIGALRDSEVLKALNEELVRKKEEKLKEERKWTTFLQRPARPVPRAKYGHVTDPEVPLEPYKIKIVKQPKPKVAPDYKPQDFETGPLPWEQRAANEPPPPPVNPEDPILIPETEVEYLEALDNLPESEVPDLEDTGIPLPPETPSFPEEAQEELTELPQPEEQSQPAEEEEVVEDTAEEDPEEMEQNKLAEQILESIQGMVDPSATMEQQLMQMRGQLAALAQLPGVIKQTLELVTNQLEQLTKEETTTTTTSTEEQIVVEQTETTITEIQEISEQSSSSLSHETVVEVTQGQDSEGFVTSPQEDVAEPLHQVPESQAPVSQAPVSQAPVPVQQQRNPEESAQRAEGQCTIDYHKKELMAELQLEHQQRQVKQRPTPRVGKPKPVFGPLVPQERPLVLPGGRRWRNPNDAYNEQLYAETLAAQAELIHGKAKGYVSQYESVRRPYDQRINFMKFEKPPTSMDYLKESEVFKLVHNMDAAPGRQVEHMRPIVIAESEYREPPKTAAIQKHVTFGTDTMVPYVLNKPPMSPRNGTAKAIQPNNQEMSNAIPIINGVVVKGIPIISGVGARGIPIMNGIVANVIPIIAGVVTHTEKESHANMIKTSAAANVIPKTNPTTNSVPAKSPVAAQTNPIKIGAVVNSIPTRTLLSQPNPIKNANVIPKNLGSDEIPLARELVIPPEAQKLQEPQPIRPSSRAEAIEIVTNYVEMHSAATA